ncbi:sialate O-acetylesterase [Flavivirga eckloniae]|uniref:Sialate O-acetylesterase domain-containing protein n=1 Tax=Flavivirga eckloniae TaxID=1803846 RepID=A0A2K9PN73_9FLAO|nr:sialate O-acetylesterase [Flavivirga eckloniae]AUP78509.1 hypothetical protein C1H87_07210 [Flavivirga eckloniae]
MKKLDLLLLAFIIVFGFSGHGQIEKREEIKVFFLGGQSNMDGFGYNKDLPKSLKKEFNNVWIFDGRRSNDEDGSGGIGIWEKLRPGHGTGFSSTNKENKLSERFGVELTFAKKMQEHYPNEKIAIIKYSKGGTSIHKDAADRFGSWDPTFKGSEGINQYDHFLKTLELASETIDIDNNGIPDRLVPSGILWMQGESDAHDEDIANQYYDNLKLLMTLIRGAFRKGDLPIVIGKISDSWNKESGKVWKYGEIVQAAQEKLAIEDSNVSIIRSTRYYKYSDPYHYDSNSYLDLGEKFACSLLNLINKNSTKSKCE